MANVHVEGEDENAPQPFKLYILQSEDINIPPSTYNSIPYATVATISTKNLNPCAEGLEEALVPDESEDREDVEAARANRMRPNHPRCCRRYSCCFPLIVIIMVWLMMMSAQSFEHCPNCVSSDPLYLCAERESRADYYCKADRIEICCYYGEDECREVEYPEELHYSMGEDFILHMRIVILICLVPLIVPCGVPYMAFKDCRKAEYSKLRQTVFDILCTISFIAASGCVSWVVIKYYEFPDNRCSSNSELFGITNDEQNSLLYPNVWIMSQTTYSSFFGFMVFCSFTVLGTMLLILQAIAYSKAKRAKLNQQNE